MAPSLYDMLAPVISAFAERNEEPRDPPGIFNSQEPPATCRDVTGAVMPVSLYTRATRHPVNTAAITAATAAVILGRRRPRD